MEKLHESKNRIRAPEGFLTVNEACKELAISRAHIYNCAVQGKIKIENILGRSLVRKTEIERILRGDEQ